MARCVVIRVLGEKTCGGLILYSSLRLSMDLQSRAWALTREPRRSASRTVGDDDPLAAFSPRGNPQLCIATIPGDKGSKEATVVSLAPLCILLPHKQIQAQRNIFQRRYPPRGWTPILDQKGTRLIFQGYLERRFPTRVDEAGGRNGR